MANKIPTYGIYNPSVNILKNGGFGSAFATARKAGKKDFIWRGRRYSTQTSNEVKSTKTNNSKSSTRRATQNTTNTQSQVAQFPFNYSFNQPSTYWWRPSDVRDGEMWGYGSQAHPVVLPEITVTHKVTNKKENKNSNDAINLQAILQHKIKNNVNDPYIVIDKNNQTMTVYQKDKPIENHEVTLGNLRGDGYRPMTATQEMEYWKMPRFTPGGIFTIHPYRTSMYNNEPMYQLIDNGKSTRAALHAPAGAGRAARLNNGIAADNRVSYGCISPQYGVMQHLFEDNIVGTPNDTVYIIPELKGNYIRENPLDGKLETVWNNTPSTYTSPDGWKDTLNYSSTR